MASRFQQAKARHLQLGRRGERLAARALREVGLELLARNYRGPSGEIDLVARQGGTLCFVEVKTRRRQGVWSPASAVGHAKRQHIGRTARAYLRAIGRPDVPCRFDIVEVLLDGNRLQAIRHWPHAFGVDRD